MIIVTRVTPAISLILSLPVNVHSFLGVIDTQSSIFPHLPSSFVSKKPINQKHISSSSRKASSGWGVGDDWNSLYSQEHNENDVNPFSEVGADMIVPNSEPLQQQVGTEEDEPTNDIIDYIHHNGAVFLNASDPILYDTAASEVEVTADDKEMEEIGLLIRCNESPQDLLVKEGRAVEPLLDSERWDVFQCVQPFNKDDKAEVNNDNDIVTVYEKQYKATPFFLESLSGIFMKYATMDVPEGQDEEESEAAPPKHMMDATAVSKWMRTCLNESIGRHDKRVHGIVSRYATYSTANLNLEQFQRLYMDVLQLALQEEFRPSSEAQAGTYLQSIWRDFAAHNILPPNEVKHLQMQREFDAMMEENRKQYENNPHKQQLVNNLMDECEILDWGTADKTSSSSGQRQRQKPSHELVELAEDGKTPKRIPNGSFVFIDEESCIGCTQCAQIAPSTFTMLENGRARTFSQSSVPEVNIAVSACPVNCMHKVAFHELKELENARDHGDGHSHHRHMGGSISHTPLHVAGMESDANHKSSWYHYLKQKCYMSGECPQRGCYDCPMYDAPGKNPYFQELEEKAQKIRTDEMLHNSMGCQLYRHVAEL